MARMWLADEFWLLSHHDVTGRPKAHGPAVAVGVAAALLGELVLLGRVTVSEPRGLVCPLTREPPPDALAHALLDAVCQEPQPWPVGEWLAYLATDARAKVAERLVRAGQLEEVLVRRVLRRPVVEVLPRDMAQAAWPAGRLRMQLRERRPLDMPDVVLAGLVEATGLTPEILWEVSESSMSYRDELIAQLPAPLLWLVNEARAAKGRTVLAHRT